MTFPSVKTLGYFLFTSPGYGAARAQRHTRIQIEF